MSKKEIIDIQNLAELINKKYIGTNVVTTEVVVSLKDHNLLMPVIVSNTWSRIITTTALHKGYFLFEKFVYDESVPNKHSAYQFMLRNAFGSDDLYVEKSIRKGNKEEHISFLKNSLQAHVDKYVETFKKINELYKRLPAKEKIPGVRKFLNLAQFKGSF